MLGNITPMPMLAVKDPAQARRFYEEVLGFVSLSGGDGDIVQYRAGELVFMVYPSQYAGTNQATALTWTLGDQLERTVEMLKGRGVRFEHYDLPDTVLKGDIHQSGPVRNAWFKDPDGNIHGLSNM